MRRISNYRIPIIVLCILTGFLLLQCSSSKILTIPEIKAGYTVKIYMNDGKIHEGLILERAGSTITLVSEADHQPHVIKLQNVRRMEKSDKNYDRSGYRISEAEIQKYKSNRNAWGYAIGGIVVGGAAGLVFGLPFWLAEIGNVPPYFTAGIGAIAGSIIFGAKGIRKDHELAVEKIRYIREKERALLREKEKEEKRLEELRRQKAELLKKLEEKKKKQQEEIPEEYQ